MTALRFVPAAIVAIGAVAGASAMADEPPTPRRLTDAALQSIFSGTLVEGVYASGIGFTEHTMVDGTTDYREDGEAPRPGVWYVAADLFCFDYSIEGTGGCFEIWQRSENCFDLYAIADGAAKVNLVMRMTGYGWDSRLWRVDAPSTCPAVGVAAAGAPVAG